MFVSPPAPSVAPNCCDLDSFLHICVSLMLTTSARLIFQTEPILLRAVYRYICVNMCTNIAERLQGFSNWIIVSWKELLSFLFLVRPFSAGGFQMITESWKEISFSKPSFFFLIFRNRSNHEFHRVSQKNLELILSTVQRAVVPEQACNRVLERVCCTLSLWFLSCILTALKCVGCLSLQTNQCLHIHLCIYYSEVLF